MLLSSLLLLALLPATQNEAKDALRRKPLIPPPAAEAPPVEVGDAAGHGTTGAAAAATPVQADPGHGPRPLPTELKPPFEHERPLLDVDGARIMASELNELVLYYRSFRPAATDLLLMDAVAALIPLKVLQSRYANDLLPMRMRMNEAAEALRAGVPFQEVVKKYSDDDEAEDSEARYTFGRERAVQPFDRVAFTATPGGGPAPMVLTKYGFHLIEPLAYVRGATPQEDLATMRHVLVMYPELKRLKENGVDIRAWIKEQCSAVPLRVLQPGLENLVPPEYRAQIVR